jgi:hypothetical protein
MKAPTSLFDRPGRATAVIGAVVAVSATAAVALLSGTATATPGADQSGKCTKNVNVRAEPDTGSRIVALCEEGTAVKIGESRDGFLRLTSLGGWAAQEYISVNGRVPAPSERATGSEDDDDAEDRDDRRARRATDNARESGRADRQGSGSGSASGSGSHGAGTHGTDADADADESSTDESGDSAESGEADAGEEGDSEPSGQSPAPRPGGGLGGLLG